MSGYFGAVEGPKGPLIGKLPLSDVDELVWWRKMWLVWVFVVVWHHFTIWDQSIAEKQVFCSFFGCFRPLNHSYNCHKFFLLKISFAYNKLYIYPSFPYKTPTLFHFFFHFLKFIFSSLQQMLFPGKKVPDSNGSNQYMDKCF